MGRVIPSGVLFLAPAVVLLLLLVGWPLAWLVLGAFGAPHALSVVPLLRALSSPLNIRPLANTLILAAGASALGVALGVPLAWAVSRTDMRCRDAIRGLVGLGYIMPPYLSALAYIILLGPDAGYVNRFLAWSLGLRHGPFDVFSLGGVTFVIGLHVMAFPFFLTESALTSLDAPLEEAAQVLGATRFAVTLRITLPLVAPAITGGGLLAAVELDGAVRTAGAFGLAGATGIPADTHLRSAGRVSASLGRRIRAVADPGAADCRRAGRATPLPGASVLRYRRGPWRAGAALAAWSLAVGRAGAVHGRGDAGCTRASRCTGDSVGQPQLDGGADACEFHTGALCRCVVRQSDRAAWYRQQFRACVRCGDDSRGVGVADCLYRSADDTAGTPAVGLSGGHSAGVAGHGDGRRHATGLHSSALADIWHHLDPAGLLHCALRAAGGAQFAGKPGADRSGVGGSSARHWCGLVHHDAHGAVAVDTLWAAGGFSVGVHTGVDRTVGDDTALHWRHRDDRCRDIQIE